MKGVTFSYFLRGLLIACLELMSECCIIFHGPLRCVDKLNKIYRLALASLPLFRRHSSKWSEYKFILEERRLTASILS